MTSILQFESLSALRGNRYCEWPAPLLLAILHYMILRRLALSLIALMGLTGFVVEGPRGGGTDPQDHLDRAPRWSMTQGSLVETGERGIGGGIEYVMDDSLCELEFIDDATCDDIHTALTDVLDEWASGHPSLYFTDITGKIAPSVPLAAIGQSHQGAEIDFFAQTGREFPPFRNIRVTGYTLFYERPEDGLVLLPNGEPAEHANRIASADVRINASRCFYINTQKGRPDCLHFPSIMLHEVGHALGFGHPEESPRYNLDTDARPVTQMQIDCVKPSRTLRHSPFYDGAAVMVGRDVQGPGRWRRGLTPDDVGARDALYPHCDIRPKPRFTGQWGAYAIGTNEIDGRARFEATEQAARTKALSQCDTSNGKACEIVASFSSCFAYATGSNSAAAHAQSPRSDYARANAVLACAKTGEECRVTADFCAFE